MASVDLLTRRQIEAGIVAPLVEELSEEFGRAKVLEVASRAIHKIAKEQGGKFAEAFGGRSLDLFGNALEMWTQGGALEIEMVERTERTLFFNVTRCKYAELYKEMGISDLGLILSCNRDFALIEGFNPDVILNRTRTIMQGGDCCDFRFSMREDAVK